MYLVNYLSYENIFYYVTKGKTVNKVTHGSLVKKRKKGQEIDTVANVE